MIDRAVVASRIKPKLRRMRTSAAVITGYEGVRRHGNKRSLKGGSGEKGCGGMWAVVSPSYRDAVTHDARWSVTRSS